MGLDVSRCLAALRLSLGRWSTDDEVDRLAADLAAAAR
jgi:cysteine desulfurase